MIKPIETIYNGYRFRSRLEARWSVFFDALGIKYEYESEGFMLSDGTRYLPDFYLPDDDIYVEVKANRDGVAEEMFKVVKFVNETWNRVLVLTDVPNAISKDRYWFPIIYKNGLHREVEISRVFFMEGYENEKPYIITFYAVSQDVTNRAIGNCMYDFLRRFRFEHIEPVKESYMFREVDYGDGLTGHYYPHAREEIDSEMNTALLKARQARFEHGETPKKEASNT